jgi:hypothetical protein
MKITIFPNIKPHPRNRREKDFEASKVANEDLTVVTIETEDDLINYISENAWSPSIFRQRKVKSDFVSADFLALDIDDGMTISECEQICLKYNITSLCLPSPSYTPEKEKFRLVIPLAIPITMQQQFDDTWEALHSIFPNIDTQCCDSSRFFFGCKTEFDVGFWIEGDLYRPAEIKIRPSMKLNRASAKDTVDISRINVDNIDEVLYCLYREEKREKVPETIAFFIENASSGLPGEWWCSLNNFVFTATLQGCTPEAIYETVSLLAPTELDQRDERCIEIAINDGLEVKEDE